MLRSATVPQSDEMLTDYSTIGGSTQTARLSARGYSEFLDPEEEPSHRVMIDVSGWTAPPWFGQVAGRIMQLNSLEEDWDSYGGRSPSVATAVTAIKVLALLANVVPAPDVVPTSTGGVQLEWSTGGVELEIEVLSPVRLRLWYADQNSGATLEMELLSGFGPVRNIAAELFG